MTAPPAQAPWVGFYNNEAEWLRHIIRAIYNRTPSLPWPTTGEKEVMEQALSTDPQNVMKRAEAAGPDNAGSYDSQPENHPPRVRAKKGLSAMNNEQTAAAARLDWSIAEEYANTVLKHPRVIGVDGTVLADYLKRAIAEIRSLTTQAKPPAAGADWWPDWREVHETARQYVKEWGLVSNIGLEEKIAAALVAERERCAKIADDMPKRVVTGCDEYALCKRIAEAIREETGGKV